MKKYVVYYRGLKRLGEEKLPDIITDGIKEDIECTRLMLAEMYGIPEKKVKAKIIERKV